MRYRFQKKPMKKLPVEMPVPAFMLKRDSKPVGYLTVRSDDLRRELNRWGGGRSPQ
jgi:hypothetical protein